MRMYILSECCTLFGVNPKTFHKWLAQEGMQLQSLRADSRVRYLTQEQVDYLMRVYGRKPTAREEPFPGERPVVDEHSVPADDTVLGERMSQFEQRLRLLEDELRQYYETLHALQQQIQELTVQPGETNAAPVTRPPAKAVSTGGRQPQSVIRTKKKHGGKNLPRALVLLRVFAERHHVSMKQASAAGKAGKIAVVRGKWLVNSRWATEALDQHGQQEFYAVFHTKQGFLPCEHCPHEHSA
jgi:hypothetical protein